MLRRIIDANNFDKDGWPDLIRPVFTNTGREMEQTYKFLHEMESQWNVPMVWIEMSQIHGRFKYKRVDFKTASREGEPFRLLADEGYLPTRHRRICTHHLKVRLMKLYMKNEVNQHYNSVLGYRYDEPHRKLTKTEKELSAIAPMHEDSYATRENIDKWWKAQPFHLHLPQYQGRTLCGNCDLCFLKGKRNLIYAMRLLKELGLEHRIDWWIEMEGETTDFLVEGVTYKSLKEMALSSAQIEMFDDGMAELACHCTD